MGLHPLMRLREEEAVDTHKQENHKIHVQASQKPLGDKGVDGIRKDEGADQPHNGAERVHLFRRGFGLFGALIALWLHIGLGGYIAQLHQLVFARAGKHDNNGKCDCQNRKQDDIHGVVASLSHTHGLADNLSIRAALSSQIGIQGGGRPQALTQNHAGISTSHHHGEVQAADMLGKLHGEDGSNYGAEGIVHHRGDIAEDHHQHQCRSPAVYHAGHLVQQTVHLWTAGAGGAHDNHNAHLESQGKLAAQAVPPSHQKLQRAFAAQEKGQHEHKEGQDDTEHKRVRNNFLCGEIELFAHTPQRSALQLGCCLGLFRHGIASFLILSFYLWHVSRGTHFPYFP